MRLASPVHPAVLAVATVAALGLATSVASSPATAAPPARTATPRAAAVDATAGTYRTLPAPARLLDTRTGDGAPATPVRGRATLPLTVAGHGGVPATGVAAVAITVTATRPAAAGYITAYRSGGTRPDPASTVNFAAGQTAANAAIVPLGTDGRIDLFNGASGGTELVVDVSGYYLAGEATAPGSLTGIDPNRLLDTRNSVPVPAGGSATVPVAGQGGVPATGVSAVVVNLTAVTPGSAGYFTAYASGAAPPSTSTLNFAPGANTANLAVVALGSDGAIAVRNRATTATNLLVDVSGYLRDGSATAGGAFVATTPTRVLDTRDGTGVSPEGAIAANRSFGVQVASGAPVPLSRVSAVAVNVTATSATQHGHVTAFRTRTSLPTASILDYVPGRSTAALALVPVGSDGRIALHNGSTGSVQLIADVVGYVIAPEPAVEQVPTDRGFEAQNVSCAGGRCLAVDSGNTPRYATYDGSSWSAPKPVPGVQQAYSVSCTSSTFCLVIDGSYQHSVEFDGTSFGAPVPIPSAFQAFDAIGFACASSTLCLVEGSNDQGEPNAARYDGTAWTMTPTPPTATFAMSCDATTCTLAGSQAARYDGTSWSTLPKPPVVADELSCAAGRCLEVGHATQSKLVSAVLANGTWSATTALPASIYPDITVGLSCVSATWCMVTGRDDPSVTRPTARYTIFNGSTWSTAAVATGFHVSPSGGHLSCGSTTLCARADGALATWTGTWSSTAPFSGGPDDVSCVSASACLAVDDVGHALAFDGSSWSATPAAAGMGYFAAVSCTSATHCVAVGKRVDYTPAATVWNGSGWSTPAVLTGLGHAADVSCSSSTNCMVIGGVNAVGAAPGVPYHSSTPDPAQWSRYNGSAWTAAARVGTSLESAYNVSCTSATFCASVTVDHSTQYATPVVYRGSSWTPYRSTNYSSDTPTVSCAPASTTCAALGMSKGVDSHMLTHAGSGTSWSDRYGIYESSQPQLSCPAGGTCVAAGATPADSDSDALVPAVWVYDGTGWSTAYRPAAASGPYDAFGSVSCASTSFCAVTSYYLSTDPGD